MTAECETLTFRPPHLALDLWRPAASARGVVVHAHGGGFVHGSRNDRIARRFGPLLAARGIAFASISYRKGGNPRRAFDEARLGLIDAAEARSAAFYPDIRPTMFGPSLYRATEDFLSAAHYLMSQEQLGFVGEPWIAMGNSSGGLAAVAAARGLDDLSHPEGLSPAAKAIAVASIVPQPWCVSDAGPDVALLCARGDQVFPRAEVDRLEAYAKERKLPITVARINYGQHTRPVRELMPDADGKCGPWSDWLLREIEAGLDRA